MAFYVYVLVNPHGETYVGQTSDLHARVAEHNEAACRFTLHTKRRAGPWRLLHHEEFSTRADAMRREKELKSGGGRRFVKSLIERDGC